MTVVRRRKKNRAKRNYQEEVENEIQFRDSSNESETCGDVLSLRGAVVFVFAVATAETWWERASERSQVMGKVLNNQHHHRCPFRNQRNSLSE